MDFKFLKPTKESIEILYEYINCGENVSTEFKYSIEDSRKLAKTISAFANTNGGKIYIGIKDNKKIIGIKNDEELYMVDMALKLYVKPKVNHEIKIWQVLEKKELKNVIHNKKEKYIIELIINKSENGPHFAKNEKNLWKAYFRLNDQNIEIDNLALHLIKTKKKLKDSYSFVYSTNEHKVFNILKHDKLNLFQISSKTLLPIPVIKKILTSLYLVKAITFEITINGTFFKANDNFNSQFLTPGQKIYLK